MNNLKQAKKCVRKITASGISIYDPIEVGSDLWMPADLLEVLLQTELAGHQFPDVAIKTRSKLAKIEVCKVLGFPIPKSFSRRKIPGQNFDTSVQTADNFQIYNSEISPTRRYILIRPDENRVIKRVRVASGADLAPLDRTGKLTRKYQARVPNFKETSLASENDTLNLIQILARYDVAVDKKSPIDLPDTTTLMPIQELFARLSPLVGHSFVNPGLLQERNRGGVLHGLVSAALGYMDHSDNGRFPDIRHQLLEVKLQTSPTIDLGAISPDSPDLLEFPAIGNVQARHQDIRYSVFFGAVTNERVTITGLVLVTGKDFYETFRKFGGLVINEKYQLPLPRDFFSQNTEGIFD